MLNFKGILWNSTQNLLPILWKMCSLLRRFKSSQIYELVFLKRSLKTYNYYKLFKWWYRIYTGPNVVITLPADALASSAARPSAGTVPSTKLYPSFSGYPWFSLAFKFSGPDDVIQNGCWDLMKSHGISSVEMGLEANVENWHFQHHTRTPQWVIRVNGLSRTADSM